MDINYLIDKAVRLYEQGYSLQEALRIVKEEKYNATHKRAIKKAKGIW